MAVKKYALFTFIILSILFLFSCKSKEISGQKIVVANWAEYVDPDVIDEFEEKTGIKVIYEEFDTNESIYPKIELNTANYDLICPSDYMINKMIENNLLQKIDFNNIKNYKNIDKIYIEKSKSFDPTGEYSIPYCWGTVGILYNKNMIKEPVDSWDILWDKKYKDDILMQASVRDAFMVALARNGHSINSVDDKELQKARDDLIEQKPIVQAYVIDQVRDKMIGEEAALGVIYSGEALFTKMANNNLEYVIPKEGSNIWIDSWVIPKSAKNVSGAEKFLDFLCEPEIAYKNFKYITYSTPNKAAKNLIKDEFMLNSIAAFPTEEQLKNCTAYKYLGKKNEARYIKYWNEVQAYN